MKRPVLRSSYGQVFWATLEACFVCTNTVFLYDHIFVWFS